MAMYFLPSPHIILEEFGNSVFIVTVQETFTMHNVSQLFAIYQHYQTNSKLVLVILHLKIPRCICDRNGRGPRDFRCLFFVQQHSEAAAKKRTCSAVCRAVEVLHSRFMREDLGSGKDVDAGFSCCKVNVKKKNKWLDLTHITTKFFITESNSYEARKKSSINCSYSLCKLVEELGTEPRHSLVYSASTGLEELFLPIH